MGIAEKFTNGAQPLINQCQASGADTMKANLTELKAAVDALSDLLATKIASL